MKIIGVVNNSLNNNTEQQPTLFTKLDSSIIKDSKPFFVPNFMGTINYELFLALRVCKLGKTISERFAHRYYNAATLCVSFCATNHLKRLQQAGLPWDLAHSFDGSTVLGQWIDIETIKNINALNFNCSVNNNIEVDAYSHQFKYNANQVIEYISQFMTIKTGDIILVGGSASASEVPINAHFEGMINNQKVIDFYTR